MTTHPPGTDRTQDIFWSLARHIVPMSYVRISPDQEIFRTLVSGFVVEVLDHWFYVTAGHVIQGIRDNQKLGYRYEQFCFVDQGAGGPYPDTVVHYPFDADEWLVLTNKDLGLDYAIADLAGLVRKNLEAGQVLPLEQKASGYTDEAFDKWVVVGIPHETIFRTGTTTRARMEMIPLELAEAPYMSMESARRNQFYGRLKFDNENDPNIKNIEGMSGSPIFATKLVNGTVNYWIVGVQSGWFRPERIISACPYASFRDSFESLLKGQPAREQSGPSE